MNQGRNLERIVWNCTALAASLLGVALTYKNALEGEYLRMLEVDAFFALALYISGYKAGNSAKF